MTTRTAELVVGVLHQKAVGVDGFVVAGKWLFDIAEDNLASEFGWTVALVQQKAASDHDSLLTFLVLASESWDRSGMPAPFGVLEASNDSVPLGVRGFRLVGGQID